MTLRAVLYLTAPLVLAAALVGAVTLNANPDDPVRALDLAFAALMVGGGVVAVLALVFPWPPRWGDKPGPMAGGLIAAGLLGVGLSEGADLAGIPLPGEPVLSTMGYAALIIGLYLYVRELQHRREETTPR